MGLLMDVNQDIYQSKKESYANVYHEPFETFSPAYQLDYAYAPSVFIESPGSSGSTITTKKEAIQTPTQAGIDQAQSDTKSDNVDPFGWILPVAIIGGLAFLGTTYIKNKRKK